LAEAATVAARADRRSSRQRGPATREDIDAAALELFARLGYHATSMRAIAAAAGIQPAAIYHWYQSKEALLVHLQNDFMDRLTEKVEAAMAAQDRAALKLAAAVREHVVFHGLHPRAAFVTDSEIRALRPEPKQRLIAQRDAYQDIFISATESGVADGSLRVSNPRIAMYSTLLACTGVALWFTPDGPLDLDAVAQLQVELVLSSLGADADLIAEATA
jgi:AcrR family transcriptional regulator